MLKTYKAVLAGNYEEFKYFLSSISPVESQRLFIYVPDIYSTKLFGYKFDCVITYGTFHERKDAYELKEYVLSRLILIKQ